jgi:putative sterol carrier protein
MSAELESFFATLPERTAKKDLTGIQATYVFAVEGGDTWTVWIENGKVGVSAGADANADCTFSATEETFSLLLKRELAALPAYLSGKLKVSGDLGAAMQLQKLL